MRGLSASSDSGMSAVSVFVAGLVVSCLSVSLMSASVLCSSELKAASSTGMATMNVIPFIGLQRGVIVPLWQATSSFT